MQSLAHCIADLVRNDKQGISWYFCNFFIPWSFDDLTARACANMRCISVATALTGAASVCTSWVRIATPIEFEWLPDMDTT